MSLGDTTLTVLFSHLTGLPESCDEQYDTFEPISIPGYTIIGQIGEGGKSRVFKALDTELQREVALKVLRLENGPIFSQQNERFIKEIQTLSQIQHPHAVTVYSIANSGSYRVMTMELMETELAQELDKHPQGFDIHLVDRYLANISNLLECTAKLGIIHCDIKPGNILIDKNGTCKLADFGIATTVAREIKKDKSPLITGTPPYMAPEQVEGDPVSAQTDVYGLGATAFQLLTGAYPFPGNDCYEILSDVVNKPTPYVSEFRDDIPPKVDRFIHEMMAKNPEDRPTASEAYNFFNQRVALYHSLHSALDRVHICHEGSVIHCRMSGVLQGQNAQQLPDAIQPLLDEQDITRLVIDGAQLSLIGSEGLAALMVLWNLVGPNRSITLRSFPEIVIKNMADIGILHLFTVEGAS